MNESLSRPVSAIYERVSVRSFKDKPIPEKMLKVILTAGTMAPASGNMQPWEFIVVDNPQMKEAVVKNTFSGYYSKGAKSQDWIMDAGVIIVACTNFKRTIARYGDLAYKWAPLDTASAVQNMLLTATALGLAGCWVGGFDEAGIRQCLNIPPYVEPIGLVPMGYPDKKVETKEKIPIKWVTHKNSYNVPYFSE